MIAPCQWEKCQEAELRAVHPVPVPLPSSQPLNIDWASAFYSPYVAPRITVAPRGRSSRSSPLPRTSESSASSSSLSSSTMSAHRVGARCGGYMGFCEFLGASLACPMSPRTPQLEWCIVLARPPCLHGRSLPHAGETVCLSRWPSWSGTGGPFFTVASQSRERAQSGVEWAGGIVDVASSGTGEDDDASAALLMLPQGQRWGGSALGTGLGIDRICSCTSRERTGRALQPFGYQTAVDVGAPSLFAPVCNAASQRLPASWRPGDAYPPLPSRVICSRMLPDVAE